jgi:hypothetical protein
MPGPTCQSQAPLKRLPVAGLMCAPQLLSMRRQPELCHGRRPCVPPRAPPPASLYPLSAEAKPHLLSPPHEAAISTPPQPLQLHAALA